MERCTKCNEPIWDFDPPHSCTEFFITSEDEENESYWVEDPSFLFKKGRRIPTLEEAAEDWAKHTNEDGEYCLMDTHMDITVTRGDITMKFRVGAEHDIHYSIEELDNA